MDRGSKRKASAAALASSPTSESRASKRQKTPEPSKPSTPGENPAATKEVGLRFMKQLKSAMDKSGNPVATEFLTLPSRKLYPDYYEATLMPLAIDTIEAKLERLEYRSVSAVESDVRRLVQNAKDFNESSSDIFQNAERIRKLTHNFMSKNNPAHKDRNYHPAPTPLSAPQIRLKTGRPSNPPVESNEPQAEADETEEIQEPQPARRPRGKSQTQERHRSASTAQSNVVTAIGESQEQSFCGKSFQHAQEQLIIELLDAKDPSGDLKIFEPFANLPTRQLIDYYQIIKDPTSLKGILKKVRGIHGRHEITGVSDFKTWDAFEQEVQKIWNNARAYNEDGSELFQLSVEFEKYVQKRLAEARKVVNEPPQPTLKLNMSKPAPIKLKLGAQKASPAPTTDANVATPVAAAERAVSERQSSTAAQPGIVNGHGSPQIQKTSDRPPNARSSSAADQARNSIAADSPATHVPNGIKAEHKASQSPAPVQTAPTNPTGTPSMAPPVQPPVQANGTPVPGPLQPPPPPFVPPQNGLESKWRLDGKDASDALITNVTLSTHPSLGLSKPFGTSIPPHQTLSQQSVTLNLPHQHHALQLATTLSSTLGVGRAYKLFVTVNGQRASPSLSAAAQIANMGFTGGKRSFFDVKLMPGVNRIEIECVAISAPKPPASQSPPVMPHSPNPGDPPATDAAPQRPSSAGGQPGLDLEKASIFVNLLR